MPAKRTSRSPWPVLLIAIGFILIILSSLFFFRTPPPAEPGVADVTAVQVSAADVPRVSLSEAKTAYDAGEAVFVDVRDAGAYADSRIPGAVSIPLNELPDRMDELDPQDWIITYCT